MVIHLLDDMHINKKSSQRYVIRYKDKESLELLSKLGSIIFKSPVVNTLFIDTDKSKNELLKVDGVMSVTLPRKGRLLSIEKRSE